MKILSIDLVGYKRFRLARLNRVQYTPSARQQLILGTNGSGKSSLLDELSPLPAHHSNFITGGYKHVSVQHGSDTYDLRSDFKKGNHHSFKKNGTELNEGGTYQVQLRLVRDEFRYTDKLHDLLTGRIRFTEMRPQERREWITLLSETDWTYALGMYNQFRSRARDAQGAYKHSQQRYVKESESLLQMTNDAALQTRYTQLRDELNTILTEISPGVPEYHDLAIQMDAAYQQCVRDSQRLLDTLPDCTFEGKYKNLSDIEERIQQERMLIEVARSHITRTGDEISKLEATVRDLGGDIQSREPVDPRQIETLKSTLASFKTARFHELPNAIDISTDSVQVMPDVYAIFRSIPDNSTERYSRAKSDETVEEITRIQSRLDERQRELNQTIDRLSHMRGLHDINCPRCNFIFKEGVTPEQISSVENRTHVISEAIQADRALIQPLQVYLEESNAYAAFWNQFRSLVVAYPRLKPLWDEILDTRALVVRPNEQLHILQQWEADLQIHIEKQAVQQKLTLLEGTLAAQRLLGTAGQLEERFRSLETELLVHTTSLKDAKQRLEKLERDYRDVVVWLTSHNALDGQLSELVTRFQTALLAIKNQALRDVSESRHLEMAAIQKRLTDRETLQGIVNDLARDVEQLEAQFRTYQLLAQALSPTEGLIAQRLRDAIFSIVDQMNAVIGSVWSHELKVLECGFEQSDLDYKFPVYVESPDNVTPDISRASKGQQEMINIAFKLTAMLYLDMLEYPLFMDEPGEGFDEQHRDQIMSLIRQMLDSGHYSQLFMVSHFASNHGAFLDAEILALDTSNIALPGVFNEHVLLE